MYMKDGDIADFVESCAQELKALDEVASIEDVKREVARLAAALEELAKDLREW